MAILYKLYQDTRKKKGTDEPLNTKTYNKWFARTVQVGTIESKELAEKVAYSASATAADTLAVINALANVMKDDLQEGYIVKLDGLGSFKIGIKTTPALEASSFTAAHNITGARVNFLPEYTMDKTTGKKSSKMTDGAVIRETVKTTID